tara:strand:+ start:773 stop:1081 length:309 start_codon:yes stop_codon:yes gene_type:complete
MAIVEYKLDPQDKPRSFNPKTIPSWITDGGYWINPDGSEKMIGVGLDGSIPEGTPTFTLAELQARQQAIHAEYPMPKPIPDKNEIMTDDEVNAVVKEWWDAR